MKFDAERSQIWSVFNALPLTDDIAFCRPNRGLHWTRLVPRPHRLGWTPPSLFLLQPRLRNFISFLKTQHVGFWGLTAPVNPPTSGKPLMESLPFTNISCLPRSRPQEKQSQCVRMASGAPPPPPVASGSPSLQLPLPLGRPSRDSSAARQRSVLCCFSSTAISNIGLITVPSLGSALVTLDTLSGPGPALILKVPADDGK